MQSGHIFLRLIHRGCRLLCRRNAFAVLPAGVIGVVGYYVAEAVILWASGGTLVTSAEVALLAVPYNAMQEVAGGIAFVVLAAALDRLEIKKRLNRF